MKNLKKTEETTLEWLRRMERLEESELDAIVQDWRENIEIIKWKEEIETKIAEFLFLFYCDFKEGKHPDKRLIAEIDGFLEEYGIFYEGKIKEASNE